MNRNIKKQGVLKDDTVAVPTTELTGGIGEDPNITEGKKHYIFSATGNIMVSTTEEDSSNMDDAARAVFNEVSVFFAAMTKAITTTQMPNSDRFYSLYNYEALQKVIGGSGCFVHCTEEDINYNSSSFGANFSKELLTALLGLPVGGGALSFAQAMIAAIGNEGLCLSRDETQEGSKVGNIVFVCEFLFGMPIVTATVVYADSNTVRETVKLGPCASMNKVTVKMDMHKDVYMFVTPAFIKNYASDLDTIITDKDYSTFVAYLKSLLTGTPDIIAVVDTENKKVSGELTIGTQYCIQGQNFGNESGTLKFGDIEVTISDWSDTDIIFSINTINNEEQELTLTTKGGNTVSAGTFKVVSSNLTCKNDNRK